MVRRSRGASTLGCLFSLLITLVVLYYGINLGRVWWRYWELIDRMKTAALFATTQPVPETIRRLQNAVDEIGLPPDAKRFKIQRIEGISTIIISTEYQEKVELPFMHRAIRFKPTVTQRY